MRHAIRFDEGTNDHLASLTARQRDEPGFVAPWELRVGDLRVYYDVEIGPPPAVVIVAVGLKVRHRIRIGGEEYEG